MQVKFVTLQRTVRVVSTPGAKAKFWEWHHVQIQLADGSWTKMFGSAGSTLEQACAMAVRVHN